MNEHYVSGRREGDGGGGGEWAEARNEWSPDSFVAQADRDEALARVRAQLMLVLNEVRESR